MTEMSLVEGYKIVDSFFNYFEGNFLVEHFARNYYENRGFKRTLSMKDMMALNIYRFFMQFSNLKAFHQFAKEYLKERYPNFPNYENFLKATAFPMMMLLVNSVLAKNREKCAGEQTHFMDLMPVELCKNNKILRHKVGKDSASRGKSPKGCFFRFTLHGICTADMIV